MRDINYRSIDAGPIEDSAAEKQVQKEYHSQGVDAKSTTTKPKSTGVHARPVTVINYDQYRKLEDKKERILLKKKLYLHKRETDRLKLAELGKKSVEVKNENINIQRILRDLNNELTEVTKSVKKEQKSIVEEAKKAERIKRNQTMQRATNPNSSSNNRNGSRSGSRKRSAKRRATKV